MRERDTVIEFFSKCFQIDVRSVDVFEEIRPRLFGNIAGCDGDGFYSAGMTGFGCFNRVF